MIDWQPVITWGLIVIGWIVAYIIGTTISKSNNAIAARTRKKEQIKDLLNNIVEDYINYLTKETSVEVAQLILYRITSLGDMIETLGYAQTNSNLINQQFIKLKRAISLNDDFLADTATTPEDSQMKLQTVISLIHEINNNLNNHS